jgi:hypothetical protein
MKLLHYCDVEQPDHSHLKLSMKLLYDSDIKILQPLDVKVSKDSDLKLIPNPDEKLPYSDNDIDES